MKVGCLWIIRRHYAQSSKKPRELKQLEQTISRKTVFRAGDDVTALQDTAGKYRERYKATQEPLKHYILVHFQN